MAGVARDADTITTGHECNTTSTVKGDTGEQYKVYVNKRPVVCKGDETATHYIEKPSAPTPPKLYDDCVLHTATVTSGSPNVFVHGIAISRMGDDVDAGTITSGSGNVLANVLGP